MTITVRITLTRDEVEEYRKGWKECNSGDISDEEIKQIFNKSAQDTLNTKQKLISFLN